MSILLPLPEFLVVGNCCSVILCRSLAQRLSAAKGSKFYCLLERNGLELNNTAQKGVKRLSLLS